MCPFHNTTLGFNFFFIWWAELNLIKLLGAYLGAYLSQVDRIRRLNKRLKVL